MHLLDQPAYDFIKTNPDLNHIIYLVLSGSRAYGTAVEGSDTDLRGALIEPPRYVYGLENFEQFEDLPSDTVIYSLRKFVDLLTKANPNVLELLGVEEDCIVKITEEGRIIRNHAHLFLSKRVIHSFGNYAVAQMRRLQNALCRDTYTEAQQQAHLQTTLVAQMEHFNRTYTQFPKGAIDIYTQDGQLKLNIQLEDYPLNDFVGIYSELNSITKTYSKLNHRNNKKTERSLFKHAMHLIRLLLTGTDILNGKGIVTHRQADHDLLMDIRHGKIPFEKIWPLASDYQRVFEEAAGKTTLPDTPDIVAIEGLMIQLYGMGLKGE